MALDHQHPAHQNTKWVMLSELAKINEIKLIYCETIWTGWGFYFPLQV
jgi:hypothetical protein